MTIEQEVGIGLAYVFARDAKNLPHEPAYAWAKERWMEFLPELDTANGKMLMRMARTRRKSEEGQKE